MSKRDTLKTAKICLEAIHMATDGYSQVEDTRKASRKERQKARKIIQEELKHYGKSQKKEK